MIQTAFFLFALLIPWLLGFAVIKPFLRQRQGYLPFALGVGYLLGWFLTILILRAYDYFQRPFDIIEIVIIECIITLSLLFIKAKYCIIEEQRLEKAPSNFTYFLVIFLTLLLLYRWGLTAVDLFSKPVSPWDGWASWSAKAKIFYYFKEIPELSRGDIPFWYSSHPEIKAAAGASHPYFISLVQTYSAMAWGDWDDNMVNWPWLGASVAVVLVVFGGLRYLGVKLLPSFLTVYAVVSLPVWDTHISLSSYADIWVGFALLVASFLLVIVLSYREWRLLACLFTILLIVYLTKHTALVFTLPLGIVVLWRFLGGFTTITVLVFLALGIYWLYGNLTIDIATEMTKILGSGTGALFSYNPVLTEVWREWMIADNWHYIFIASTGCLVLLASKAINRQRQFKLLIVAGIAAFLMMLVITFLTTKISAELFIGYFNRVTLYFIPIFVLIPASVYSLLDKDENTIPPV